MRVPREGKKREEKVREIIENCRQSLRDRQERYTRRRKWFLNGCGENYPVRCNRLKSHMELVASYLFSPENTRLSITSHGIIGPETGMHEPAADYLLSVMTDSGILSAYSDALLWSLIYDSMLLKLGWNSTRNELAVRIIDPYAFGVIDECETSLQAQEAFIHEFTISWDEAVTRLIRSGQSSEIKKLRTVKEPQREKFPEAVENMIIASGPAQNKEGRIIGQAGTDIGGASQYIAETYPDLVRCTELWVWNYEAQDYIRFLTAGPGILLTDSRDVMDALAIKGPHGGKGQPETNDFMRQEMPFVHICPYKLYDYFWGESLCERLIPLQEWTTKRLEEIEDILARQVNPPLSIFGVSGLAEEKAASMNGPGALVYDQSPAAKIDRDYPVMPEDLFREFNEIGELFLEASGLTRTIAGRGEKNVRSEDQARLAAATGSSRIKRTAIALEDSISRTAELVFKLTARNDATRLMTGEGIEFVMAQIQAPISLSVSGHSQSPIFVQDTRQLAFELFKASAIDKEGLLRMVSPPNADALISRLKKRERMEMAAAQQGQILPGTKEAMERARSHKAGGS